MKADSLSSLVEEVLLLLLQAQMANALWINVDGTQLVVVQLTPGAGEAGLVISPVWLNMTNRLVAGGNGADLGELWLKQVDQQADGDQASDDTQPDGLNVTLVVAEVHAEQEQDGDPTRNLDGVTSDVVPTPCCRGLVKGGDTVVDLGLNLVGGTSHVILLHSHTTPSSVERTYRTWFYFVHVLTFPLATLKNHCGPHRA